MKNCQKKFLEGGPEIFFCGGRDEKIRWSKHEKIFSQMRTTNQKNQNQY